MNQHYLRALGTAAFAAVFAACATNPYTGKSTLALESKEKLNSEAFAAYNQIRSEELLGRVITDTPESAMVQDVGDNLRRAAELWAEFKGHKEYLDDYEWEYMLVENDEANAWCMAGGKICVYTGLLPLTQNADGLAAVLGHELSHALLNHGQQRASAETLQTAGTAAIAAGGTLATGQAEDAQALSEGAKLVSTYLGTLPYSRSHETEADKIGFMLMLIAGYSEDEGLRFWERFMTPQFGSEGLAFSSTHPIGQDRLNDVIKAIPEARQTAGQVIAYRINQYGK